MGNIAPWLLCIYPARKLGFPGYNDLCNFWCRYSASAQDKANGIVKMHRKVTSDNVQDFSTHIPKDDVAVNKDEDIVYRRGVLTHSAGVTTAKIMPVVCMCNN